MQQAKEIPVLRSIQMTDDKIVRIEYNDNLKITTAGVVEVFSSLYDVTNKQKVARLIIIGKENEITGAARKAVALENKTNRDLIIAEAVVVNSFYQKLKVNIYFSLIKKIYPIQCFVDANAASQWLKEQIAICIE